MTISLKCTCGSLRGTITNLVPGEGKRIVCLCDDCQAYAHYLGRADILDANGGTDVVPVAPSKIKITHGSEHLKCVRLVPNGMFRWYAGCCKTPIANSMSSINTPFAGVLSVIMDHAHDGVTRGQAVGPIYQRVQGKFGIGPLPQGTQQTASLSLIFATLRFLLMGTLKRAHKPSPFFDLEKGKPIVEPYVLTSAERDNLRPMCGPKN